MILKALKFIGGASALVAVYSVLAIVVALNLALIGAIDSVALANALAPVFDVALRCVIAVGGVLQPASDSAESAVVQVVYLK